MSILDTKVLWNVLENSNFHQFERCNSNETCPFLIPNSAPMSQNGGEKTRKNFLIPKKVWNFLENVIFLEKSRKFFENFQKCNKCRFWIRECYYGMCWKTAIFHQFERCKSNETCPFLFPNSAPLSQNGGEKTRKTFFSQKSFKKVPKK